MEIASLLQVATDWKKTFQTAERNFNLPNMRMHLRQMPPGIVTADQQAWLDQSANSAALRNLALIVAQREFQKTVLAPLDVPGLFFKGINLVARYYPDLGLRPCRDIDILVPGGTLRKLVLHALEAGYRLVAPLQPVRYLDTKADIEAALHYRRDAMLVSPAGVAIDLQVKLDKYSGIFSPDEAFATAEPMEIGGTEFLTMPAPFLFNYICHHHARHVWSHLHWLSDLDAMVSAESFDPDAALALASRLGQIGSVKAGLELQQLMSPLADWTPRPETWRGLKFLELALRNLEGDLELEKRIAFGRIGGEFMYDWQAAPGGDPHSAAGPMERHPAPHAAAIYPLPPAAGAALDLYLPAHDRSCPTDVCAAMGRLIPGQIQNLMVQTRHRDARGRGCMPAQGREHRRKVTPARAVAARSDVQISGLTGNVAASAASAPGTESCARDGMPRAAVPIRPPRSVRRPSIRPPLARIWLQSYHPGMRVSSGQAARKQRATPSRISGTGLS